MFTNLQLFGENDYIMSESMKKNNRLNIVRKKTFVPDTIVTSFVCQMTLQTNIFLISRKITCTETRIN